MKGLLLILLAYGLFQWYQGDGQSQKGYQYGEDHNKVIMYSLTTCGYCKQKVRQLKQENIAFTEYFIDTNPQRRQELYSKLDRAAYPSRNIGTPTFDVHGTLLTNNPSMAAIKQVLASSDQP